LNLSVASVASCSNFLAIIEIRSRNQTDGVRAAMGIQFSAVFLFFRQNCTTWLAKSESVVTGLIRLELPQSPQMGCQGVSPNFWRNLGFRLPNA
jgi:hypothetical protein